MQTHSMGTDNENRSGFEFTLREASGEAPPAPLEPLTSGEPLTEAETQAVLQRLPSFQAEAETGDFARRDPSKPAPRPGETVAVPFPPPEQALSEAQPEAGPLQIERAAPEGEVEAAANVSVTFNQAMIPLATLSDLAAEEVPMTLEPQPENGRWRWLGTKTLVFEGKSRLPGATRYRATVPGDAVSVSGSPLGRDFSWSFATPPAQATAFYPQSGATQFRDTAMAIAFDQKIDPAAILQHIQISADGAAVSVRSLETAEAEADPAIKAMLERYGPERCVAFKATGPLPYDAQIQAIVPPGLPSAEGPLRSQKAQTYSFRTFGPLQVTQHRCGWRDECRPRTPWTIQFNNQLDQDAFREDWVRVEPAVRDLNVSYSWNTLQIVGLTEGSTNYRVRLSHDIRDVHGQTLGKTVELTFEVGEAEPAFFSAASGMTTLDPYAPPRLSVFTVNYRKLHVRLYRVGPEHLSAFTEAAQSRRRDRQDVAFPGELALEETVSIAGFEQDGLVETAIDLSRALDDGLGQLIVLAEPREPTAPLDDRRRLPNRLLTWAQRTQIGLTAFQDNDRLLVWATDLKNGRPLRGARVALMNADGRTLGTAAADGDGMTRLSLPDSDDPKLLAASLNGDTALLPERTYGGSSRWRRSEFNDQNAWFVFDDRGMYRPGESVRLKGWVRTVTRGERGDLKMVDAGDSGAFRVFDPRNNLIGEGAFALTAMDGFDISFELPDDANTGPARVQLELQGAGSASHRFQIQEFRRPEFETVVAPEPGPYFVGSATTVEAKAAYFAGGALPRAGVRWTAAVFDASFTPPNWDQFTFGVWRPWWDIRHIGGPLETRTLEGVADAMGVHRLRLDFESSDPATPKRLRVDAAMRDVNNQEFSDGTDLLVHPGKHYVGLRTERIFVSRDTPFAVEAIVVDLDGEPMVNAPFTATVARMESVREKGEWREVERDPQTFQLRSAAEPVSFSFKTSKGGVYRISAEVMDDSGRPNHTRLTRWVAGGETRRPADNVTQESVTLIPDQPEYQGGDQAEILVRAPFFPAEGVMTVRRDGVLFSERFSMSGDSHRLRVPIEDWHAPNLHVRVDLAGAAERIDAGGSVDPKLPLRPAFAVGEINLAVPPLKRLLQVDAVPRDRELQPGAETEIEITVRDASGAPSAGAEVAVIVVDEAVLSLSNYQLGDPLSAFYPQRGAGGPVLDSRAQVQLAAAEQLMTGGAAIGGPVEEMALDAAPSAPMRSRANFAAAEKAPGAPQPIAIRADFSALAAFFPAERTGADGRLAVKVKLPDNLTRYRVMAVAAEAKRFGKGESTITARLPLMVRPAPPRFLNFGDRFQLALVVQNQTDAPLEVHIAARAQNVAFPEGQGRRVVAPARDRVRVGLPAEALLAGTARFQAAAVAGDWADAAELELPVWTPATTEAFAVYGELDQGALLQPVQPPLDVYPQFGGLEITASSTALHALTDAFVYLVDYPFACSEQLASRILAIVALRDILTEFGGDIDPQQLKNTVERDLEELANLQNADGGYGFWRRGEESWPFLTIHVAHAMARAADNGWKPSQTTLDRLKNHLRGIDRQISRRNVSARVRYSLRAYAAWTLRAMGESTGGEARDIMQSLPLEDAPLEGLGWLLPLLDESARARVVRHLQNRVSETAAAANFVTRYDDGAHLILHSDRRADGIILESLIETRPQDDLIPKLTRGLLGHRVKGRWGNTQENVFILLALKRYFQTYEKETPDFVARVWLGEQFAGEQRFQGRQADRRNIHVPMAWLDQNRNATDLILAKEGSGRLYYRLGLRYAPTDLDLKPESQGFYVERRYEPVDDPDDVRRNEDGTWVVKAGARVRVALSMVAPNRRYHVALVDPLPAGFEPLNPALAATGPLPPDGDSIMRRGWWHWRWHQHENLRDERAEAFATYLRAGVHDYSYVARATTPGAFIAPPAKAEEMYHPETFGRSGTDRVVVE